MPCSKSFRPEGGGEGGAMIRSACRYGLLETSGCLDAKKRKKFWTSWCLIWSIYFFFLESRLECIGSVLGYPRGMIGTKSGSKIEKKKIYTLVNVLLYI